MTISARDLFAALAPQEPPEWFQPDYATTLPPSPNLMDSLSEDFGWGDLSEAQRELLREWVFDPHLDIEDEAARNVGDRVLGLVTKRLEEHARAKYESRSARYFAWRWYYADQMIRHSDHAFGV